MTGQEFMWDHETDDFYLVNFQERRYMKIAWIDSKYYELCRRLYCKRWEFHKNDVESKFDLVTRLAQIDGCEDLDN